MSELNPAEAAAAESEAAESEAAAPRCACTLFAVVRADGKLVRDCGALNSNKIAVGVYEVRFIPGVRKCAWVATIGLPGQGVSPNGEISVAGAAVPQGVVVRTFNPAGVPADRPFHLAVHCCPGEDED